MNGKCSSAQLEANSNQRPRLNTPLKKCDMEQHSFPATKTYLLLPSLSTP